MPKRRSQTTYNNRIMWFVFGFRILLAGIVFLNPLAAWLIAICLDLFDMRIIIGYKAVPINYSVYDKYADMAVNALLLVYALTTWTPPATMLLIILFGWRLLGVGIYTLIHKRWLYVLFSNAFFEYFAVLAIAVQFAPHLLADSNFVIFACLIVFVLKIPYEWMYHISPLHASEEDVRRGDTFLYRLLSR